MDPIIGTPNSALIRGDSLSPTVSYAATTPWTVVLGAFLNSLDSPATRRNYSRILTQAMTLMAIPTLAALTGARLLEYRQAVMASGWSPNSKAQALAALRSYLRWSRTLGAHGLSDDVLRLALKAERALVRRPYTVLTDEEITQLRGAVESVRDDAILAVMLGAGLRVAEVAALSVSDARDGEGGAVLYVRQGKGGKDRQVPVQGDVTAIIRKYLKHTHRHLGMNGSPLFLADDFYAGSRNGSARGLSARGMAYLVKRLVEAADIQGKAISPHSLRHSFAVRFLRAGGNVVALSKVLGHASVVTTQRYLDHLELGELRKQMPTLPKAARKADDVARSPHA